MAGHGAWLAVLFQFLEVKFSTYLNRRIFEMGTIISTQPEIFRHISRVVNPFKLNNQLISVLQVPPFSMTCKKVLSMDCSPDSKYVVYSQPSKTDLSLKVKAVCSRKKVVKLVRVSQNACGQCLLQLYLENALHAG